MVLFATTSVFAIVTYTALSKVNINSKPQVLQAEFSQELTPSGPEASPSRRPTSSLTEPKASPSRRPTSTPLPTSTPTPTPSPTTPLPPPATSEQINAFIERFASQYGVDANVLRHIGVCESGLNTLAVNGPYAGIYQFSSSAWINNRKLMGEDTSPDLRYNAEESVQTAAYVLSVGKGYLWPNCLP